MDSNNASLPSGSTMTNMGLQMKATNFDRRGATRVVPMKVLALGLGRTGTSSLRAALIQLGYVDTYHMITMMLENPSDWKMWKEAYERKYESTGPVFGRKDWDALLGHCMAVCDWPAVSFSDELIESYPDAKVILTVRDSPEVWHKSALDTIYTGRAIFGPTTGFFHGIMKFFIAPPQAGAMEKIFTHHIMTEDFPQNGAKEYVKYNEHIRKIAPKGQFLEFNVKQGWEPLCEFLGVPVPDSPFPRVNDTKTFQQAIDTIKNLQIRRVLVGTLIGASCIGAGVAAWTMALPSA